MAQWRPLHRRITQSEKILALGSNDTARWIYCALLPYTDREGRINANPMGLAGTILEGFPYTPEQIEAALEALAKVGLIELYQTARHQLLAQFTNFELSKPHAKEPQSELPGPEDSGTEPVTFAGTPSDTVEATSLEVSRKVPGNGLAKPADPIPEKPGTVERPDVHVHVHVQREKEKLSSVSETVSPAEQPPAAAPRLTLADLVEIWNQERGLLVKCTSTKDAQFRRLGNSFLKRHERQPDGGREVFRAGITVVREDHYWLGRRSSKLPLERDGAPYTIVNYLRHVETKADTALDDAEHVRHTEPDPLAQYRERGL